MKKILLITNRLVIGGPSRHVAILAEGLQSHYEVLVVGGSAAQGEALALDLFKNLKNQPILIPELSREISLSRDYKVYRKLRKIIREFQPDIVHTHTSKAGALGRKAAVKEDVSKIVHTYHGLIFENYFSGPLNAGFIKLDRRLAKSTHHIIALSESQKAQLVNRYRIANNSKISIIPLAINKSKELTTQKAVDEFRQQFALTNNSICIGIIGRLVKIKNIAMFIDGIEYLKRNSKLDIRAFIIGDGPEKENLMQYAKDRRLCVGNNGEKELIFTSWRRDLDLIYSQMHIIALTSLSEGTPMSIMEAQMAGKSIIASNVGGVPDIVPEGTGLLFDLDKPNDFFKKLLSLVESKELRAQLSAKAKSHAQEQYRPELMLSRTIGLYETD